MAKATLLTYLNASRFSWHFILKYLCEYDAKIEKVYTFVCGHQDVLVGIENSKNLFHWTVPVMVSPQKINSSIDKLFLMGSTHLNACNAFYV